MSEESSKKNIEISNWINEKLDYFFQEGKVEMAAKALFEINRTIKLIDKYKESESKKLVLGRLDDLKKKIFNCLELPEQLNILNHAKKQRGFDIEQYLEANRVGKTPMAEPVRVTAQPINDSNIGVIAAYGKTTVPRTSVP